MTNLQNKPRGGGVKFTSGSDRTRAIAAKGREAFKNISDADRAAWLYRVRRGAKNRRSGSGKTTRGGK